MQMGVKGDAEARHLDMKLLALSIEELDWSRPYILRSLGRARSLVLGMHSGIPSRSSSVDWRENRLVASVTALRGGERWNDQWWGGEVGSITQTRHRAQHRQRAGE